MPNIKHYEKKYAAKHEAEASAKPKKKNMWLEWLETILMALVLYFAIDFCIGRVRVQNISMQNTFFQGNLLMVNKLNYKFSEPRRGDVVIFEAPVDPGKDYIKRLIGLPGDTIEVKDGDLYINSEKVDEPWLHEKMDYSGTWTVPAGEYFVLGDNRNHSSDSHVWGTVPRKNFMGNAFFEYWPLNRIHVINKHITLSTDKDDGQK